jgi:hypothetical protein
LDFQSASTKNPRYYPAEDIKPVKAVYKVKQNVSYDDELLLDFRISLVVFLNSPFVMFSLLGCANPSLLVLCLFSLPVGSVESV